MMQNTENRIHNTPLTRDIGKNKLPAVKTEKNFSPIMFYVFFKICVNMNVDGVNNTTLDMLKFGKF